ncbi:unnamed protein product, partial [Porites evermanni]
KVTVIRRFGLGISKMMRKDEVAAMRIDYKTPVFDESGLVAKEPFMQFDSWFKEATTAEGIGEANAMVLSTCGRDCRSRTRVVLSKGYDKTGFTFFTNYESKKGEQLVRVEGGVEKLSNEESEQYFHSRPLPSQIGAIVSKQSSVIESRQALEEMENQLKQEYADEGKPIPKPENWGGFKVIPDQVEFWQGHSSRLHDRFVFRKPGVDEVLDENLTKKGMDGWVYERLAP